MKITILCENASSDIGFLAEWGFSAFIQTENVNILFDTGYSDVYIHNAKEAKLDLEKTDFIILSHYHNDHARGLQFHNFQSRKKIVTNPELIQKLPKNEKEKITNDFEIVLTKKPLEFSPEIFYLGEIPRANDFEKGTYQHEPMFDDSALVIKTPKGAVVISGCSHSGICNICEYAKKITKQKLYAVIGGFHLFEEDKDMVQRTMKYFQENQPCRLYPMHCVDFPTLVQFYSNFKCKKCCAGDVINL